MSYLKADATTAGSVDLYYEDRGRGQAVILVHGWPLNGSSWRQQVKALVGAGHRVITYDRRGAGLSGEAAACYDYETFTTDLHRLIESLELSDVTLVGFSTGSGEVAHYLGSYGSAGVRNVIFISAMLPFLEKTAGNPDGMDNCIFAGMCQAALNGRLHFLTTFLTEFFNVDLLRGKNISSQVVKYGWDMATLRQARQSLDGLLAWRTDFRPDLACIDVPVLVIHGDADRILPLSVTGIRTHQAIRNARLIIMEDGPHGLLWTHAKGVNRELVRFLA